MSYATGIEELSMDHPLLNGATGGEVGATGMGDDLHYTGEESWFDCMMAEMTGRGGSQKTPLQAFAVCTF